jgi:Sortilin, neurotensin receptor 3,
MPRYSLTIVATAIAATGILVAADEWNATRASKRAARASDRLDASSAAAGAESAQDPSAGRYVPGVDFAPRDVRDFEFAEDDREGSEREGEEEGKEEATYAREAARWRYQQRVNERGEVPIDGLVRAKEQLDAMRARRADAGLWSWTWLGPGNIGGRIRSILIHPTVTSRMWVGSVSGGIWRSDNSGSSWFPVDDFMANLAVTTLAFDPTNTNTMYAGTGEGFFNIDALPGAGIFKSVDGGVTWNQLPSTNNILFKNVNRIAHHPTQTNVLYAATTPALLWKTTNGGDNWSLPLALPASENSGIGDVKVHPTIPNRVLVGSLPDSTGEGEVYFSTDGGASWDEETTGLANALPNDPNRSEVSFGRGDTMYVSMDRSGGQLWRSTNAGTTWSLRNSGTNYFMNSSGSQGWYDNAVWVDPTNSNMVIVGGIDLWRSTNGGTTFSKISDWNKYHTGLSAHADQHAIVHHPGYNGSTNRQVFFGNDGGIQRATNVSTVDDSTGWTNLANGLGITQFYGGAASADGSVILGGAQDNDKLRYNGGSTSSWVQVETGDGGYCAIDFTNSSVLYGERQYLSIRKSTNGGASYFNATSGLVDAGSNASPFIAPFAMDPFNNNTLFAGSYRVWKTTNGAASWTLARDSIPGLFYVSAVAVFSSEIWVGYTDGTVSFSTNGGTAWANVDGGAPGLPNRRVTDIAISPYFAGHAVVTFSGYESDNVWVTTNYGGSWIRRTGTAPDTLPALQVNTVTYHPASPNWLYIGTDLGILATETFGVTWNTTPAYDGNDGPVNVEVDDLFWYGERMVAATHGRGMYRSRPLDVVYVDQANNGSEDGSVENPYNTVGEGVGAAGNGTTVSIRSATYTAGAILLNKRGTIAATGGTVIIQ